MKLLPGIYEQIINQLFKAKINSVDKENFYIGQRSITKQDSVSLLSKYLHHLLEIAFDSIDDQDVDKSVDFVNDVIRSIGRQFNIEDYNNDVIDAGKSILTSVVDKSKCDYPDIEEYLGEVMPLTSLSKSSLFFGGKSGEVSMQEELNREIRCADEICWVVSFIKVSGLNLLYKSLKEFTSEGKKLRIITTTYMGATEYSAITKLANLPNTEIKISYDGSQDRLHAKAYIFIRNSGFHTAYIGSSNISSAALRDGREWNFKATQYELPDVIDSVRRSFEVYWNDETFETFKLGIDDDKLKKALNIEEFTLLDYSKLDIIRAKDYQLRILERLDYEREVLGNWHNLIVAATGTGKTVISAYDFKRYYKDHPNCHFLFIAHRQEILKQALDTYRYILDDQNFGELMYSGQEPTKYNYLFASKDSLINKLDQPILKPDYYDYIVVDEVHHIVAQTYVRLMTHFKPKVLLGLTATPERTNASEDITIYFDNRISAEIRLPEALNAGILCPFRYYGIPDGTDLTGVKWTAHGYDASELTKIYTANDMRTGLILRKLEEYVADSVGKVRALCFCVNKEHAKYMCAKFTLAGLRCEVLTSENDDRHRKLVREKLKKGEINYLFVVDIFNEGVDIPEIDLILFLRPTESLTIFLQQFGRGLRKVKGKEFVTVLDFVGHARQEFNYKDRFEALIGRRSQGIKTEIKNGFPNLPFGCAITLEEKAKEEILANIDGVISRMRTSNIIKEVREFYEANTVGFSLGTFLNYINIPLHRIYRNNNTWNDICVAAEITQSVSRYRKLIYFAVSNKWLATDSYSYFNQLLKFVERKFRYNVAEFDDKEKRYATMFYYDLCDREGEFDSLQQMFDELSNDEILIKELGEVLTILRNNCIALEKDDNSVYKTWNPLKLHGVYTRNQIQAALGTSIFNKKSSSREGVERRRDIKLEAMYVDIIKDPSSAGNYDDYAMSRTKFHWESQRTVSDTCPTAEAYRNGDNHMLLFVRQQKKDPETNVTMGYTYLGEVTFESMEGSRPLQIVWDLVSPMSEATFAFASQYKAIG
jgi:superfamily II DNA or RNA helicase